MIDAITLAKEHDRLAAAQSMQFVEDGVNRIGVRFESWSCAPNRFFLFNINGKTYCGEKLISPLVASCGSPALFCSLINREMILGELSHLQTSETGVEIYYRIISLLERQEVWQKLILDRNIDVYFPFAYLQAESFLEIHTPENGWVINDEIAYILSQGEVYQRQISIQLIQKDAYTAPVIYDPACSTGEFLRAIKLAVPQAYVIGQDISEEMCACAKTGLDEVFYGDSISPVPQKNSCDYIFFRFLNSEVVSTKKAKQLFQNIMLCLKPRGKAVLFGFTPLLLVSSYIQQQGYVFHQCNAYISEQDALIQYYVIQSNTPQEVI